MTPPLHDQVALVTGAGRGIGRAIALRLAQAGCRVAALARTAERARGHRARRRGAGRCATVLPVPADVTRDGDLEAAVRVIIERLGRITVLVNNAGFAPPRSAVLKTSLADWDRTLATCLRAPMVLTRLVLPDMLAHGRGAIVNIASIAGKQGRAGEAAYAAAKFGLLGFTQSLFAEVREHGIKVTAICPGLVDTDLIPPNARVDRAKFLQPSDVAEAVYDVLSRPLRACPTEIVLEPQYDPEALSGARVELRGATALITGGAHRLGRAIALALADAGARRRVHLSRPPAPPRATRCARSSSAACAAWPCGPMPPTTRRCARALADDRRASSRASTCGSPTPASSAARRWRAPASATGTTCCASTSRRSWFRRGASDRSMQRQGAGCIVALADVAALRPWADYVPYCVAKRAVVGAGPGPGAPPRAAGAGQCHRARAGPVPRRLSRRGAGARDRAHAPAPRRRSARHRRRGALSRHQRLRDRHGAAGRRRSPACLTAPASAPLPPDCWRQIFANERPVAIEIGPGRGEFLLASARADPQRNFFAIEHSASRTREIAARLGTRPDRATRA